MQPLSKFRELAETASQWKLTELFEQQPHRAKALTFHHGGIYLDLSKQFIVEDTIDTFANLAGQLNMQKRIAALFDKQNVNPTENRPAMHWLLRSPNRTNGDSKSHPESIAIEKTLVQMAHFTAQIHSGEWKNEWGHPITDIVNLGVGGSDLGPRMCVHALKHWDQEKVKVHFVSNIDGEDLVRCLKPLNPKTTVFIITSKSFSTLETLQNATSARNWLLQSGATQVDRHFVAVSSNIEKATAFGINTEQVFAMWDWVGGRYSLWSAAGLSIMLAIGEKNFRQLLTGAHSMDTHFQTQKLSQNLPFLLGAISVYQANGFNHQTQAVIPYDEALSYLPSYLQQLAMESNGKSTQLDGSPVNYQTCPVIWGGVGTNSQHSFHQLMHQGQITCPVDFLLPLKPNHDLKEHHRCLVANCLAQSQALMVGKTTDSAHSDAAGAHKQIPGNKPSTLIVYEQMNPKVLGALIALYEHKTYVESVFWNINAFDQWGVELGKQLAKPIIKALNRDSEENYSGSDASTNHWIKTYQALN